MKYKDIKIYPHHFWFVFEPSETIIIKHVNIKKQRRFFPRENASFLEEGSDKK